MESLRQTMRSRRDVLAGAGALAGAGMIGTAAATQADEDGAAGNQPTEVPARFDQPNTDVDVLNYALTLEYLEDDFYDMGLEEYDGETLAEASAVDVQPDMVAEFFETISAHEQSHTEQLARVIEVLGGEPIEKPQFEFGIESAEQFIATAKVLENTGVSAYAGVAPMIESPDILSAALSIHSVEARHAATLNYLAGESPFPNAYDNPLPIPEVLAAIQPFIVGGMEGMPDEDGDEPAHDGDMNESETETEMPGNETEAPGNESDEDGGN